MKKRALFVGVNEYEDGCIARLDHAVDDAEALAAVFDTLLGFEVKTLKNPGGGKEILRKVGEVTQGLGKGDLFFFYFAGHGFRVKENHVLVCREDSYGDLEDEYDGLPMGQLKKRARGPWNRMLVIDACQNDIRKTRGADEGMSGRDLALILEDGEGAGDMAGEGVQVVVTNCSEGQKALEVGELGHGLFTSALLETVKDHARMRCRLDLDGFRAEMGKRMGELARKYRLEGKQNPMFRVPGECGIVLLEGEPDADSGGPSRWSDTNKPTTTVPTGLCAKCGAHPFLTDMFDCPKCGKTLCKEHRGEGTYWCEDCAAEEKRQAKETEKAWAEKEEGQKRQEAEWKAAEWTARNASKELEIAMRHLEEAEAAEEKAKAEMEVLSPPKSGAYHRLSSEYVDALIRYLETSKRKHEAQKAVKAAKEAVEVADRELARQKGTAVVAKSSGREGKTSWLGRLFGGNT